MKKSKLLKIIISWLIIPIGYLYCGIMLVIMGFFFFSYYVYFNFIFLLIYLIVNVVIIFLISYFLSWLIKIKLKQLIIIGFVVIEVLMAADICFGFFNKIIKNHKIYVQILIDSGNKDGKNDFQLETDLFDEGIDYSDLFASETDDIYVTIYETNTFSDLTNECFVDTQSNSEVYSDSIFINNKIEMNIEVARKLFLLDSRLFSTASLLLFNSVILSFVGINVLRKVVKAKEN